MAAKRFRVRCGYGADISEVGADRPAAPFGRAARNASTDAEPLPELRCWSSLLMGYLNVNLVRMPTDLLVGLEKPRLRCGPTSCPSRRRLARGRRLTSMPAPFGRQETVSGVRPDALEVLPTSVAR